MDKSILAEELTPLNTKIEQVEKRRETYLKEMQGVDAELEKYATARKQIEALQDVCNALDRLSEVKADHLFWKGMPGEEQAKEHVARVKEQVEKFEKQIRAVLERQASLQEQIDRCNAELDFLREEVSEAYDREMRRQDEFVVEREATALPFRAMVMPWNKQAESERRFRKALLIALLLCIVFGSVISLVKVPVPDRSVTVVEIPQRLAKLVKKEPPKQAKLPKKQLTKAEEELKKTAQAEKQKPEEQKQAQNTSKEPGGSGKKSKVAQGTGGSGAARRQAERTGVLAFKDSFKDLMDETPVAGLGTEARIMKGSPRVKGQAVATRSLVAIQGAGGTSGGIGYATVSRNVGNGNSNRLGGGGIGRGGGGSGTGVGLGRVESAIADIEEAGRPLSNGPGPGRTDEEIQIIFDRYKATLYRIYNRELRNNPTLRGKILLRISIETNGTVSMCKVESTDLDSPALVAKIVERIMRFNFGAKEGVQKLTILYPIDFLPAA